MAVGHLRHVEHHYSYSSGRDRVAHFRAKRATAAVDNYNIPGAPGSTLVQAVSWELKKSPNELVGNGGKSPTAAPTVVPPPIGYVNG